MPSGEHGAPIALAKLDPGLVTWLLAQLFDVKVPDYHHAGPRPTDVQVMVPRTYHADGMLLYCDATDKPVLAAVVEVQRGWDPTKRWTWKLYVAQFEAELMVDTALLVFCPDAAIARRYRGMFEFEGLSLPLRPFIFTPKDVPLLVDVDMAKASPALAVFSAICHGRDARVDGVFPALAAVFQALGPTKAILYHDIVLAGLPQASRARWEAFMSTTIGSGYHSELFREIEAKGEGRAVLTVLDARGVQVPDDIREQILACADLAVLDTWLRRAATADNADDVIRP
jgi:hypothetical protein